MTKGLIQNIKHSINAFPSNVGIIGQYSPANIIDGATNPDCNRKRIIYGAYALAYTGTNNSMHARTTHSIALYESNAFDGQYFMSLDTGRPFNSKKWTQLPIDESVIDKIHRIAKKEKQLTLPGHTPLFEWAPGLEIETI